jgi:hypothetical protein
MSGMYGTVQKTRSVTPDSTVDSGYILDAVNKHKTGINTKFYLLININVKFQHLIK